MSLQADAVAFDAEQGVYTISLEHCQMLTYDALAGALTFAVRKDVVNEEASTGVEMRSQDQYIGRVLEHILESEYTPQNTPDPQ